MPMKITHRLTKFPVLSPRKADTVCTTDRRLRRHGINTQATRSALCLIISCLLVGCSRPVNSGAQTPPEASTSNSSLAVEGEPSTQSTPLGQGPPALPAAVITPSPGSPLAPRDRRIVEEVKNAVVGPLKKSIDAISNNGPGAEPKSRPGLGLIFVGAVLGMCLPLAAWLILENKQKANKIKEAERRREKEESQHKILEDISKLQLESKNEAAKLSAALRDELVKVNNALSTVLTDVNYVRHQKSHLPDKDESASTHRQPNADLNSTRRQNDRAGNVAESDKKLEELLKQQRSMQSDVSNVLQKVERAISSANTRPTPTVQATSANVGLDELKALMKEFAQKLSHFASSQPHQIDSAVKNANAGIAQIVGQSRNDMTELKSQLHNVVGQLKETKLVEFNEADEGGWVQSLRQTIGELEIQASANVHSLLDDFRDKLNQLENLSNERDISLAGSDSFEDPQRLRYLNTLLFQPPSPKWSELGEEDAEPDTWQQLRLLDDALWNYRRKLQRRLRTRIGFERIPVAAGDAYDRKLHESHLDSPTTQQDLSGRVAGMVESGFRLKDQVLRRAIVRRYSYSPVGDQFTRDLTSPETPAAALYTTNATTETPSVSQLRDMEAADVTVTPDSDSAVSDPPDTDSAVSDPPDSDSAVSDSAVSDSAVSDPPDSDSAVSDSAVSDSAVSDPAVSDSAVSDPAVSAPAVSDPPDSDSAVSDSADSNSSQPNSTAPVWNPNSKL